MIKIGEIGREKSLESTEKLKLVICCCFKRSVILAPAQAAIKNPRK